MIGVFSRRPALRSTTKSADHVVVLARRLEATQPNDGLRSAFDRLRLEHLTAVTWNTDHVIANAIALMSQAVQAVGGPAPYHVQRQAAVVMARGEIAEMATGEGKTLAVALAVAALAVTSRGVHVATANEYLARRDCTLMGPAFAALGLSASLVEAGLRADEKRRAYASDVVYGTADTFAFDFLRDVVTKRQRQQLRLGQTSQLALLNRRRFAIVIDEADHILIDEASTPLVLASDSEGLVTDERQALYRAAAAAAERLVQAVDWQPEPSGFGVRLTAEGMRRIAQQPLPTSSVASLPRPWIEMIQRALEAAHRVRRDVDYVVREQQVQIVDPATGRIQPERHWQDGLHQAIEVQEGLTPSAQRQATAQITRCRFFDLYQRIAGCSGTAWDARRELAEVYRLKTTRIPLRRPSVRQQMPTVTTVDTASKFAAIADEVQRLHATGRPVLLGTQSIRQSEQLASHLAAEGLPCQVLNGLQQADEAEVIAAAGRRGALTIATDLAGRGTDILIDEAVCQLGGLHVIVVSPRHSTRLDRQLIGRGARQGQPGSARRYISLDDTLIRQHAPWVRRTEQLPAAAGRAAARAASQATAARMVLAQRDRARESFFQFGNEA